MDVAHYFHRWLKFQKNRLVSENFMGRKTQISYILLTDLNVLNSVSLFGIDAHLLIFLKV